MKMHLLRKNTVLRYGSIVFVSLVIFFTLFGCENPAGNENPVSDNPIPSGITITPLTQDTWTDGSITDESWTQWFSFTATVATQFIHFEWGPEESANVQLYNADGTENGSRIYLYGSSPYISLSVTVGNEYYIRVTPFWITSSGNYKIQIGERIIPSGTIVTPLTKDTWTDGSITDDGGVQWFSFTATAASQFIHFERGSVDNVYIRLYNADGTVNEYMTHLSDSTYTSRSVTVGDEYYIRVTITPSWSSDSGSYKIQFNEKVIPFGTIVTPLTKGTWADGSITDDGGVQWFSFTATAATQFIHFERGTLDRVYVQLYNTDGTVNGYTADLSGSYPVTSRSVTVGNEYYIRVTPYSSRDSGGYKIQFNEHFIPSGTTVTPLSKDTWADGSITDDGGVQWFSFTATAASQFIHFQKGSLTGVEVQLYNTDGTENGYTADLSSNYPVTSQSVTVGDEYYIRVTPSWSGGSGGYKIQFNENVVPSGTTVITLSKDTWADGSITDNGGVQWFSFTATEASQFIHFERGTLDYVYVQLYNTDGTENGYTAGLSGNYPVTSLSVTVGDEYYIRVTPYSSRDSGSYKIKFNEHFVPSGATPLGKDTWADGNIIGAGGVQWFSFTATAASQFIHFQKGSLTGVEVKLYNADGTVNGYTADLSGSTLYTSRSVTVGNEYYIRVTPFSSSGSGSYKIQFNEHVIPFGTTVITLSKDTWADGNIIGAGGVQWFSFTATAASQFIHFQKGSLTGVEVELYNTDGTENGSMTYLSDGTYTSRSVTVGNKYYLRVTPSWSRDSGNYRIVFNESSRPPAQ